MMQAYYHSSIADFININQNELIGILNKGGRDFSSQYTIATTAWESSVQILQNSCRELITINERTKNWHILFEYEIPRLASRIDAIILAEDLIFVIEFKYERKRYEAADTRQVEDYTNDLFDFHLQSKNRIIIPVLLAPLANSLVYQNSLDQHVFIKPCLKVNAFNFSKVIYDSFSKNHNDLSVSINPEQWKNSEYRPTPTIIQAATALFAGQKVETITKSGADENDLKTTTDYLIKVIKKAIEEDKKIVCFVTGVPGAGKTLVGLNIVHEKEEFGGKETNTAYFSGNGPLINVLREALSRDHLKRQQNLHVLKRRKTRPTKKESDNKVKSKIQNLHLFIKDGIRRKEAPAERIVVFDEAQRCWNALQFSNKAKQNLNRERNPFEIENKSEAELLFEFMSRHDGWSVIIALVGGGQEINTGEGGIAEWGVALESKFQNWEVHISEELMIGDDSTSGNTLFEKLPDNITIHKNSNLHLKTNQRSFRANHLNEWVNALIENKSEKAFQLSLTIKENYPLCITRDLSKAKEWLKAKKSGNKRIGLIASSGGLRLKASGVNVREIIDEAMWFLNDELDVRSSQYLEIVATEYKVQGLELDWAGVCWDADLRRDKGNWDFKNFSGTKWNQTKQPKEQTFLLNTYRVLLTRAREGMILFIPEGNADDQTRLPEIYESIYEYLVSCGLTEI
jgi:hypothetical protein